MEIKKEIFCSNHLKKHAKKHCGQCNLNLCNECALDLHIDHYSSLSKIDYAPKKKFLNYSELLCEEIKKIINGSLDGLSSSIYANLLENAKKGLEEYKKNERNKPKPKFLNVLKKEIKKEKEKEEKISDKEIQECIESNINSIKEEKESEKKEDKNIVQVEEEKLEIKEIDEQLKIQEDKSEEKEEINLISKKIEIQEEKEEEKEENKKITEKIEVKEEKKEKE